MLEEDDEKKIVRTSSGFRNHSMISQADYVSASLNTDLKEDI